MQKKSWANLWYLQDVKNEIESAFFVIFNILEVSQIRSTF